MPATDKRGHDGAQSLILTPIFLTIAPKWCRRKSTVGIAPGAQSAGRLHASDIARAVAPQIKPSTWAALGGPFV
jgi:hypothetical protein